MLVLAAAAVRYSSKPFKSWARKVKIAATSAARTALQAVPSISNFQYTYYVKKSSRFCQAADGLQAENFYWREKKTPVSVVKAASLRP